MVEIENNNQVQKSALPIILFLEYERCAHRILGIQKYF